MPTKKGASRTIDSPPVLSSLQTVSITLALAVPAVERTAVDVVGARILVCAARTAAIVIVRFGASGRAASVTVLARRRRTGYAGTGHARLRSVARIRIVAFGITRTWLVAREAAPGACLVTTIGQVAVAAIPAVRVPIYLLTTVVRTVVAVLTRVTIVIVVAHRWLTHAIGWIAGLTWRARDGRIRAACRARAGTVARIRRTEIAVVAIAGVRACSGGTGATAANAAPTVARGVVGNRRILARAGVADVCRAFIAIVTVLVDGASDIRIEQIIDLVKVRRQRAVDGRVLRRACTVVSAICPAAAGELADDFAGAVEDR